MKKTIKITAVILAAVLILSLCSCGKIQSSTENCSVKTFFSRIFGGREAKLSGQWFGYLNLGTALSENGVKEKTDGDASLRDYLDFSGLDIPVRLVLDREGTFEFYADKEDFRKIAADKLKENFDGVIDYYLDRFFESLEDKTEDLQFLYGLFKADTIEVLLYNVLGVDVREYARKIADETVDRLKLDDVGDRFSMNGTWKIEGSTIVFSCDDGRVCTGYFDKKCSSVDFYFPVSGNGAVQVRIFVDFERFPER